ncbi:HEAT repeat domain-containing protein OS=Streptomyces cyaneofuscatus OX=66883 GN=G3I52_28555 PE=4 SV=1 [Streptomyces cyaneofuscatus]
MLLAELPGSALLPLAELILLLSRRTRGGFARSLLERALREGPAVDVVALMAHQDRATYRLAYRIAVERGLLTPAELATTAATCGDVTLQELCAEAAVAALTATDGEAGQAAVLGRLLTARAARVRSAGVTALRRAGRHGEAEPFLADRSAVVRACARYVLRQGGIDPLPLYRALCAEPAAHPGAAAGLGECGERATDTGTLWALVEHPLPAVRVCAITGLRALEAVVRERLTSSLDDPSPAVVRAATRALLPEAAGIPETLLRERTAPDRPRAVRVAAERLLRAAGRALPG